MEEVKPYGIIYCLTCKINGKVYIGQTTNFKVRERDYKSLKCKGQPKIYNALKKHGVDNFFYDIIDTASCQEQLDTLECYYMALSMSRNKNYGYNDKEGGSNGKLSDESKLKISLSKIGKKRGEYSEEWRRKLSVCNVGRKHTEEAKRNMKEGRKGFKHSQESKLKMSKSHKGKIVSEEAKKNMGKAQTGRKQSKETILKRINSRKGYIHSEETKKKISEARKRRSNSVNDLLFFRQ